MKARTIAVNDVYQYYEVRTFLQALQPPLVGLVFF
jgi:hypothetical protein